MWGLRRSRRGRDGFVYVEINHHDRDQICRSRMMCAECPLVRYYCDVGSGVAPERGPDVAMATLVKTLCPRHHPHALRSHEAPFDVYVDCRGLVPLDQFGVGG
jgi:hypothetical protein